MDLYGWQLWHLLKTADELDLLLDALNVVCESSQCPQMSFCYFHSIYKISQCFVGLSRFFVASFIGRLVLALVKWPIPEKIGCNYTISVSLRGSCQLRWPIWRADLCVEAGATSSIIAKLHRWPTGFYHGGMNEIIYRVFLTERSLGYEILIVVLQTLTLQYWIVSACLCFLVNAFQIHWPGYIGVVLMQSLVECDSALTFSCFSVAFPSPPNWFNILYF